MIKAIAITAPLAIFVASGAASARVITECGDDKGMGYWLEGGIIYNGKSEWKNEVVTKSRLALIADASGYDIISFEANNKSDIWSSRKSSKSIEFIRGLGADMIIVVGDLMISTYIFRIDSSGYGEVAYSVARANGGVNKVSAMRAECRPPGKW